ncbi:MAG TPA: hypothetical protein VFV97_15805 [Rhodanobacteraceae bacterium]|nr:hypothetical protein [Rhodanobacteraceae bacterium]
MGNTARIALVVAVAGAAWVVAYTCGRTLSRAHALPVQDSSGAKAHDRWAELVRHDRAARPNAKPQPHASFPPLPDGPFGATIDELKRRAEAGDASAAFALADGYRDCAYYQPPKDDAELNSRVEEKTAGSLSVYDQVVDQVNERAAQNGVDPPKIPKVDTMEVYDEAMTAERAHRDRCRGVAAADARRWREWYGRAAALGDVEAQVGYWNFAFQSTSIDSLDEVRKEKADAADYLDRALAAGDARALGAIGQVFQSGYYDEPDPFMAHAYFFAASLAPNAPIETIPWTGTGLLRLTSGNDTATYYGRWLATTASTLDPAAIAESERLGAALYASCCGGAR